jgi:hypothetical protein
MKIRTLRQAVLAGPLFLLLIPIGSASASTATPPLAKGGVAIYDWGQTVFPQGPLPQELAELPEFAGFEAGYLCDAKGIFWSDVVVSNCTPVAFKDNVYDDQQVVADAVAKTYPESDMHRGFWNRFGWIFMIAGLISLGTLKILFDRARSDT